MSTLPSPSGGAGITVRPGPASPWLGTPPGITALTALVLSLVVVPLFFPLAGLALVLAVAALVRRHR